MVVNHYFLLSISGCSNFSIFLFIFYDIDAILLYIHRQRQNTWLVASITSIFFLIKEVNFLNRLNRTSQKLSYQTYSIHVRLHNHVNLILPVQLQIDCQAYHIKFPFIMLSQPESCNFTSTSLSLSKEFWGNIHRIPYTNHI